MSTATRAMGSRSLTGCSLRPLPTPPSYQNGSGPMSADKCGSRQPHPYSTDSYVLFECGLLGKIRALGRKRGTIVHRSLPVARNLPDLCGAGRTTAYSGTMGRTGNAGCGAVSG